MDENIQEVKKDAKQIAVYVIGVVMMIIGWFLNDFMEDTDKSFGNIYSYRDKVNESIIAEEKGEKIMWMNRYLDLLEEQKCE